MSYQLIAEETKHHPRSLGRNHTDEKQDGCMEGNGYLVSWCIGRLVSCAGNS